ncbi:hypothetical protein M080_4182 [Bacteroides fragilis str. 3397 T10]|nr:hypothetical protein M080_4182 [Bacteroides fragilis str. 3397 T10]
MSWIVSFCHGGRGGEKKKGFPEGSRGASLPWGKQDMADIRYREKRKIPAGTLQGRRGSQ